MSEENVEFPEDLRAVLARVAPLPEFPTSGGGADDYPSRWDPPDGGFTPLAHYRLQVTDKSVGSTTQVGITYGTVGGWPANVTMNSFNAPLFLLPIGSEGVNIIYVQVPVAYASNGLWNASQPDFFLSASEQSNDATSFYVELTRVTKTGNKLSLQSIPAAKGDIWIGRWGPESGGYIDAFGHVAT